MKQLRFLIRFHFPAVCRFTVLLSWAAADTVHGEHAADACCTQTRKKIMTFKNSSAEVLCTIADADVNNIDRGKSEIQTNNT